MSQWIKKERFDRRGGAGKERRGDEVRLSGSRLPYLLCPIASAEFHETSLPYL